jgi:3-keto-L-gulonate-6-phosphate decarboxylase
MLPIDSSSKSSSVTDNPAENAWGKRIRENGIREGDNVVVLFGYNGKVADICPVEKMPVTICGYVLEVKTSLVKDANNVESVKRVVSFVDTDGIIREFPCADSTVMIGSIVEVNFQNSSPIVTKVDYDSYMNRQNEIKTRRIAEGASMIRTKGEPGTGDVVQAVRHLRLIMKQIRELENMREDELYHAAKELEVPYDLVLSVHKNGKLPVVNFAAGGVATPADAAMLMQLGAEGVFVGSGIFKSGNPAKRAQAIVKAVTNYNDAKMIAELSEDLGEAMVGINEQEIELLMAARGV